MYYLVVGGGGGGGYYYGGGGGGGGVKIGSIVIPSTDVLTITVGSGGASNTTRSNRPFPVTNNGQPGGNSTITFKNNTNLIVDVSGGTGGIFYDVNAWYGQKGGNSGYPQNNTGGAGGGNNSALAGGGGGGGAGGIGNNSTSGNGGNGGIGYAVTGTVFNTGNFLTSPTYFGGGGGGGQNSTGGLGGGGNVNASDVPTSGTPNTGGGGGGDGTGGTLGSGGSGVVYLAFPI